ncbi:MAG: flavodoxin-dependent (E)-4-hydroxy-3-methylbut-2-enyl-diphosphate synthase, partial [Muribaculaceae bacterium]|nr:flavodoxin-dependent (E)-4-hydroxy-3-methylbut-2-enyl-diphosphate synthase [Muribaculaceae bacterium]
MGIFDYKRRMSAKVEIGETPLGATEPIRIQSMTSTSTRDVDASAAQAARIIEAGGEYVRLTAQGVIEADCLGLIREKLRERGFSAPLVADIHFNPKAAYAAAAKVEKVRINPGNFVDPGRTFVKIRFTDQEYQHELQRIEDALIPFIDLCKANHTAIRIGVNHGSLSDRIMSRYGDTPEGMVESAMEFLRVFVKHDFPNVVISIKASNTVVMTKTVRLLVDAMDKEGMKFPLHLGVTEAGNGEDGRIKSALGIGALLHQG